MGAGSGSARLEFGQTRIHPEFGDQDGVWVIPHAAETEVVHRALHKARGGQTVRQAIEGRMAFEKYGIL